MVNVIYHVQAEIKYYSEHQNAYKKLIHVYWADALMVLCKIVQTQVQTLVIS